MSDQETIAELESFIADQSKQISSMAFEIERLKKEIEQANYSKTTAGSYSERMHAKYGDQSGWT